MSTANDIGLTIKNILKVGGGVVVGATLALAIKGSVISQGNFICDVNKNPNCGIVAGVRSLFTPSFASATATGGNVKINGGAKYNAILLPSAFSGATAASRGLRAGSGVYTLIKLDIVKNGSGAAFDLALVKGPNTGTAGTLIFDNKSATGTYVYVTPLVSGPGDYLKLGTLQNPPANFQATLTTIQMDTDVGK
jgi:hypothetical protein